MDDGLAYQLGQAYGGAKKIMQNTYSGQEVLYMKIPGEELLQNQ